jgi:hypothetical protein
MFVPVIRAISVEKVEKVNFRDRFRTDENVRFNLSPLPSLGDPVPVAYPSIRYGQVLQLPFNPDPVMTCLTTRNESGATSQKRVQDGPLLCRHILK